MRAEQSRRRLAALRQRLLDLELDALVVTSPENIRYLSGFTGSLGYLIIGKDAAEILGDSRYWLQMEAEAPAFRLMPSGPSPGLWALGAAPGRLRIFSPDVRSAPATLRRSSTRANPGSYHRSGRGAANREGSRGGRAAARGGLNRRSRLRSRPFRHPAGAPRARCRLPTGADLPRARSRRSSLRNHRGRRGARCPAARPRVRSGPGAGGHGGG